MQKYEKLEKIGEGLYLYPSYDFNRTLLNIPNIM